MSENFEHQVAVRWRDTDALGHVNHAVFLTYFEEGRDEFFSRVLGSEPIYVVARLEVDFRAEVRPTEEWVRARSRGGAHRNDQPDHPGDTDNLSRRDRRRSQGRHRPLG